MTSAHLPPQPISLPPNVLQHFYRGGTRLSQLRGYVPISEFGPEDWLAATVERAGEPGVGLSPLAEGTLFRDLVASDPAGWLGDEKGGPAGVSDTGILVKLLDADQRLPVHVHPDRPFARRHLHSCYGKTEAWYVLAAEGADPSVWVGFADDIDPVDLRRAIEEQDSDWMLSRMNKISVAAGDGILVPSRTTHCTGEGVFVVEVQEPTDFSILLEWSVTNAGREDSHLDLGFDTALQAVSHQGIGPDELAGLVLRSGTEPQGPITRLLPPRADEFFSMQRADATAGDAGNAAGYAVVVVTDGAGAISGDRGTLAVERGAVVAVPATFGEWTLTGSAVAIVCRPGPAAEPLDGADPLPQNGSTG